MNELNLSGGKQVMSQSESVKTGTSYSVPKVTLFLLHSHGPSPELCSRDKRQKPTICPLVFSEVTGFGKPSNHTCHRGTLIISVVLGCTHRKGPASRKHRGGEEHPRRPGAPCPPGCKCEVQCGTQARS